ncbi:ATP-binding cassette sub-family A member 12 [Kryptolebias marmoratus]|uniref:ATP-binding cassette, sub-family A (ABC1), member 12 n=1 Tax=Kryptolebias marmoratus TaxID=37003 RepID=A0A3Q3BEG4_KRYMA|nr:ATP-binding cassette sub-family A member 12 [Kryptolebias marmoratus]
MAFFRQLQLLLWKNGLAVIRQPLWSVTLIAWPLVLFLIIAVTRYHFPPFPTDTCYVGPRNLPSTGFFPFLQTLLCNTDSSCHNTSRLANSTASKPSRNRRSASSPESSPLAKLMQEGKLFDFALPSDASNDPAALLQFMQNFLGSSYQGNLNNASLLSTVNTTLTDQETLEKILESVNVLKRAVCAVALPWIKDEAPSTVTNAAVTFCHTNSTLFEVTLQTVTTMLTELLVQNPEEMITAAGMTVSGFDQLQNETSLWETLLAFPEIISSFFVDQTLNSTEALLTKLESLVLTIENIFPEIANSLSTIQPVLVEGLNVISYAQNWPGKEVTISLGDVVTLHNDTISEIAKRILQEVQIPLHEAMALAWDRNMVYSYLCGNNSKTMWLTAACSTGTVDMLLGWICPEKVVKQSVLAWIKHVAADDVAFFKQLVCNLKGCSSSGVSNTKRYQRSIDTQPQNSEEELFLGIGQVLIEIATIEPEFDMVVKRALGTVFQSMKAATVTVSTVEEVVDNVLEDVENLQQTFHTLSNQSEASAWISHVLESVTEIFEEMLESEYHSCEELLEPIEWLLSTKSIKIEVWRSVICQNSTALIQSLLVDWMPVVLQIQEVQDIITGQEELNVTLPMLLSEWHKLYNTSLEFVQFLNTELNEVNWMNWMPETSFDHLPGTLQQSLVKFIEEFGEELEESEHWATIKDYFHIIYWVLNYRPDVTTQPPNCYVDINTFAPYCDTGLEWPQFAAAVTETLTSPNPDVLLNCLKGTVILLQHMYGEVYKNLTASNLQQEIQGGDPLSAYLINLLHNLDDFVQTISVLPNQNLTDPALMTPLITNLLESTGLKPLLPLLFSDGPFNISTLLDIASKLGRLNQHIFTFNETDPSLPELEWLMLEFFSLEGNLTVPLSNIMAYSLLTYSSYFSHEYVANLTEATQPFTNQTSAGIVEAILSATELLKTLTDSPNHDPTSIILGYLRQLQEFIISAFRLQIIENLPLPNGQPNTTQVTDLSIVLMEILSLFAPENLQNLTQAGPDAAQDIVIQKFVALLTPGVQEDAAHFLQDFQVLQYQVVNCTEETGQNCLRGISEIPTILYQIVEMMLAGGDATIQISATNPAAWSQEYEVLTSTFFSLFLSENDTASVETIKQALKFLRLVMNTTDITKSSVESALMQTTLTIYELDKLIAVVGAASMNEQIEKVMEIIDAKECFKPQNTVVETSDCVMGLINKISGFLTQLPALHNDTAALSLIPIIVNKTISDAIQTNISSNPNMVVAQTLKTITANIKMSLQLNHLNTSEIMNEITVVEQLICLVTSMEPFNSLNTTSINDPVYAQKVYLELVEWYLERLENITSASSVSELLQPIFYLTQMQVAYQVAQTEFSGFVSNKIEFLINTLQYPVEGADIKTIGKTSIEIFQHLLDYLGTIIELQSNNQSYNQQFNTSSLYSTKAQIKVYLQLIEKWIEQPNVSMLLTNMFQWGNSSTTLFSTVTDLHNLMNMTATFLTDEQQTYLFMITSITQSLSKAIMVAEQPGGLQSEHFVAALMGAVHSALQIPNPYWDDLPPDTKQDYLETVQNSLTLLFSQNMSFTQSDNVLLILESVERLIEQTTPPWVAEYLLSVAKIITAYFESTESSGPDQWNHIILNELKTIQSLLPQNNTADSFITAFINLSEFIMQFGQENTTLHEGFGQTSVELISEIVGQLGRFLIKSIQGFMGGTDSAAGFTYLAPIMEQVFTGSADQETWDHFEQILVVLLSMFEGEEEWNHTSSVLPQFEKVTENIVKNMQAQNVFILSLQMPILALMRETVTSVNTSHLNLSELTGAVQLAIGSTLQAAHQTNGTLDCSEVLKAWEPFRQAAGLNTTTLAVWCHLSLQPVLEAFAAAQTDYSNLNTSHMATEAISVSAAAGRIVKTIQLLYEVNINHTLVIQQSITTFSNQLLVLTGQPLSPEAQSYWYKQLQDMQLQNSLSSIKQFSDELVREAPYLQPYTDALINVLKHVLDNYHLIENNSSQKVFEEAALIFLTSANITSVDISTMWGNDFALNETLLTDLMRETIMLVTETKAFGDAPFIYEVMEQFLASNGINLMAENIFEMFVWLTSTETSASGLLFETPIRIYSIIRPILYVTVRVCVPEPVDLALYEDFATNIITLFVLPVSATALPRLLNQEVLFQSEMASAHQTTRVRRRRDVSMMTMTRQPLDDIINMFSIDYSTIYGAAMVPPTSAEVMETAHIFFGNPNLNIVAKGATSDMQWSLNASLEDTIDAALGAASFFTHPQLLEKPPMDLLINAANMLPNGIPFSSEIKNIARAVADESQENLMLIQQAIQTAAGLLLNSSTNTLFTEQLQELRNKVCTVENMDSVRLVLETISIAPGELCHTFVPGLQILAENLQTNENLLPEIVLQAVVGDPRSYNIQTNWSTAFINILGFDAINMTAVNISSPGVVTFGDMLRDKAAFILAAQQHLGIDPAALLLLMETPFPNSNVEMLSWLTNLQRCNATASTMSQEFFCSLSAEELFKFLLLMAQHINTEKLVYRTVLSEEIQGLVGVMVQAAEIATNMMQTVSPAVSQLQNYMRSIQNLTLRSNRALYQTKGMGSSTSTRSTFVTLSRALCSNGITALFGISKAPDLSDSGPSFSNEQQKEEMIERFKIPRDASPFCMNMYLDMVNTTGGAIAWAFLKPMLMGQILYTPDTPITRDIMQKANATLQEFADLKKHSEDWIESSNYIMQSAKILSTTLPMLQNSLNNRFVKNFIEMQTKINVDSILETFNGFSNLTLILEKHKDIVDQITTLSMLMTRLSSCIKFDRYRSYNSTQELDHAAQELAKNRELYGSVIFKLSEDSSREREARSSLSSSASSLPPKVSYTIRMHMDNVMRTDRVRTTYFIKDTHISARQTMRYNRGFIYLQENIDRAIIETQIGQKVTDVAVQMQPFPYPCYLRDEFLEAMSFVFPLMLMIPWVLFVADFVKKLVYERELRLHEYMKMMGVNPLSHFFAWFLECAAYLLVSIFVLTMVLKYGNILPQSDGFLLFLFLCNYGLSILAFSYLVSSFFDKTYIAGLSGSLLYILFFFPFIVVLALESNLTFSQKSVLSLFSPTCFSYACQYVTRYESQGEGIHWSNSYVSPLAGDTASFGWLCWLILIDSILYFIIGAYIRMVFPGKYGIPAPWYFPFKLSFWTDLFGSIGSNKTGGKGLLFSNIMQKNQPVFSEGKDKGKGSLSYHSGEDFPELPVGVVLNGLTKMYGEQAAIQNLNVSFYEGHVTSLLGHNGAGKTTTMSLLTGLYAPTSGSIEVYGKDMQTNTDKVRKELGVCMQYDVLFDHMTTKEHLLLYGQIKAPHWSSSELHEQVRTILEETGMYAHRHKRVGTLSGGMKRKLSISIAFIGGSRLVVLDEPTTGVDPCSRRNIWDIVIQHKRNRTIIMSTHHLDEAEVLSDRIAFLERGGLKCCGSPFYLKDKLGQGYKLTLTKKIKGAESEPIDNAELKSFIQAHLPEARLTEANGGDLVYSLPPFTSSNASSYRSLLTSLDTNLDELQLGGYGICDTTLEEVFLQMTNGITEEERLLSVSETVSDTGSIDSFPSDCGDDFGKVGDKIKLTSSSTKSGLALAWQQLTAMLIKRFHHSRRDWKGLIAQILLPVLFVVIAMGFGSIKSDIKHYRELELSPALYNIGPSNSFFSNQNPRSNHLVDTMLSFPGIDNACLDESDSQVCTRSTNRWISRGNISKPFSVCKCTQKEQICKNNNLQPPHKKIPSSQIVYNLTGLNVENYLVATANDFIRNRYGGFAFGMPLPPDLQLDITAVPKNRTLSKVWFNPEGHHTMPAYLNSLNNIILRSNIPLDKDPQKYAISVSSHPYFGRKDDDDTVIEGVLQILVAVCVLIGFSITTASFAIYEVSEHNSGSKRLQHIAGISETFYWTVNFFYDMVIYLIPVTLTICVIAAFQVPAFTERQNLGAVALLFVLFGFATLPWMYLLAGVFKESEIAFISYVCINLFISMNTILSTSVLYFLGQIAQHKQEVIQEIFSKLCNAFLIFPQFNFGNGLIQLARSNIEVQILSGYGVDAYKDPYSTEVLGWMFISSIIQGIVFFTLRLLLNKAVMRKVRHLIFGRKTVPDFAPEEEDEDVVTEHHRVASGAASSDLLQINQLSKVYQHLNKKMHAVKKLSVGIPAGECFGLLGENGAGKTTTFKMLTGDVSPTDGSAQIRERDGRLVDIMECRYRGINIGYCPQVDALDDLLTGEEHLYFYARVRGISKREIDGVVNYLLKRLELNYHRNIITDGYSCGTRRKLSTALALIGHPQILLLDEPSSGMDPRTKRHLWKIISEEVRGKCAVVLTSHSMEECEALCGRLAIMVKGQFRCLGSLQHIKNRFGTGFTVKMYLAEPSCDAEAITAFMQRRFPCTYLKDQHSAMVEYHVPNAPGGVADIFNQLESNKNALQIKHFSVSQTTLDEVFINFAMENTGMETVPIHSEDDGDGLDSIKAVTS